MNFPPTIKEPKNTHALAATSAFNLKLCHMQNFKEGMGGGFMWSVKYKSAVSLACRCYID